MKKCFICVEQRGKTKTHIITNMAYIVSPGALVFMPSLKILTNTDDLVNKKPNIALKIKYNFLISSFFIKSQSYRSLKNNYQNIMLFIYICTRQTNKKRFFPIE